MKLHELKPRPGSRHRRRRVGRGIAAGQGKTCGRGTKGQKARDRVARGFEGGQTPAYRRVPKRRGTSKGSQPWAPFRKEYAILNVGALERFEPQTVVTPELLVETGLIRPAKHGVRILGEGELTKALTVVAHHFSASARAKIEAVGGTAEVL